MTPRRSSGGPQCAFEENKKESERAARGSERGSRAGTGSRRARRDRGAAGSHFARRGDRAASVAGARGASVRDAGRLATAASADCVFS